MPAAKKRSKEKLMSFDFKSKNVVLSTAVRFVKAFLPNAIKPYNLRAERQTVVDINGIVSKAAEYNVTTAPKVIEQGLEAGFEVMAYLAAQGYEIKTPQKLMMNPAASQIKY